MSKHDEIRDETLENIAGGDLQMPQAVLERFARWAARRRAASNIPEGAANAGGLYDEFTG